MDSLAAHGVVGLFVPGQIWKCIIMASSINIEKGKLHVVDF